MRNENGQILCSATDLANDIGCAHLTQLNRAAVEGRIDRVFRPDPMLDLLKELGDRHEQNYVNFLRSGGKRVVELPKFGDPTGTETLSAMQSGADVIAQASLIQLPWRGFADFLIRVDCPSNLGDWSYEVADTKLSHTTKAAAILQLCLYTEILATIQGSSPTHMYVVKPGNPFDVETLRVDDYIAYYRMAKSRFESRLNGEPDLESKPEPCNHCQICDWWPKCDQQWRDADNLKYVAGISKSQRVELTEQGVLTLTEFADSDEPLKQFPKRGSVDSFAKSHRQAQIQLSGKRSGKPEYQFNEVANERGFLRLPEPNPGDVFFDIEGNPRAVGDGLEYLFGYVTLDAESPQYERIWALTQKEEKQLFQQFIAFLTERWKEHPGMHVYHYAPYEPSAMKRLATKYGVCETQLDDLLRGCKFVDLYAITRQAIRASVESYSIKKLEPFYRFERTEELPEAAKALREIERLIELSMVNEISEGHKTVVERYNLDDCMSTFHLRNWLEDLRAHQLKHGKELPRPPIPDHEAKDTIKDMEAEAARVFQLLTQDIGDEPGNANQSVRWHLAHMLDYFRREAKCAWWDFFRMKEMEHEELLRENRALSGLEYVEEIPGAKAKSLPAHRYKFPAQETILERGDQLWDLEGNPVGSVVVVDLKSCTIDIKKRRDTLEKHSDAVFEFSHIGPGSMPESLFAFGTQVATATRIGRAIENARYDLLSGRLPRFQSLTLPYDGDIKTVAVDLAKDLANSYLAIQGPPGTGKTHVGSHMIYELAKAGKRVGVSAVGHQVIINLLSAVHDRAAEQASTILLAHQNTDDELPGYIKRTRKKDKSLQALDEGYAVGGTAWLWSDELMEQQLDYLFIDEAGQMSLAMALSASRAAKNIVLLGDPQQLEQPQQAVHPYDSGVAALSHVLAGSDTMPEERGLFLSKTWRLHPSICHFTSEQYYEERLLPIANLDLQKIEGNSRFSGSGLRLITSEHSGNQNRSFEEVEEVRAIFEQLLNGSHRCTIWNAGEGTVDTRQLTEDDILIVAPYNAQVSAIRSILPDNARVGTVDKFQGQEAPVVIYSMTSSSSADAPRGMSFLYNRNRMNVATSRAKCLAIVVCSPEVLSPECETPEQIGLANGVCRFTELVSS